MTQIYKQFYCKVCKGQRNFIEHADHKGLFICCQCQYTTSNPQEDPKMPEGKINTMYNFYKSMKEKSCENKFNGG